MISLSSGIDFDASGQTFLPGEPVLGLSVIEAVEQELDRVSSAAADPSNVERQNENDSTECVENRDIDYFKVVRTYPPPSIDGQVASNVPPQMYGTHMRRETSAPLTLGEVTVGGDGNELRCSTARISANGSSVFCEETGMWYDCVEQYVRDSMRAKSV